MKHYLNKAERQLALSLSAFETRIEENVGIEPLDKDAPQGKCPYKYKEG
jgi:hypothetical protein